MFKLIVPRLLIALLLLATPSYTQAYFSEELSSEEQLPELIENPRQDLILEDLRLRGDKEKPDYEKGDREKPELKKWWQWRSEKEKEY